MIERPGETVWAQRNEVPHPTAAFRTMVGVSVQPHCWTRTVWRSFARPMPAIGVADGVKHHAGLVQEAQTRGAN